MGIEYKFMMFMNNYEMEVDALATQRFEIESEVSSEYFNVDVHAEIQVFTLFDKERAKLLVIDSNVRAHHIALSLVTLYEAVNFDNYEFEEIIKRLNDRVFDKDVIEEQFTAQVNEYVKQITDSKVTVTAPTDMLSYEIGVMSCRVHPMSSCCLMDNTRFDASSSLFYMTQDVPLNEDDFYQGYIAEAESEFRTEENENNTRSYDDLLAEAKKVLTVIRSKE